ncbi:MAG TPA: 2-C-methyl-D-erythritol 4-phosphate cytidylyltransferase [Solirubrobacteraceae bacterium]|jgi:2-C-methyl-D-erythritol 4-phosphate cytidylyltransferase
MAAVALIVAAGRGERLGDASPKALVELAGAPLLQWSLAALRDVEEIDRIVLALPAGSQPPRGVTAVDGGAVRSDSVRRALAAAGPGDPVLVHDAARALVTAELAEAVIAALAADGDAQAAIAATPVKDTVKRVGEDGVVSETLERSSLWAVQTPQVFRRGALERALDVPEAVLAEATDDAWLIERIGGRVRVVAASDENLKITTPLDLEVAELLLARRARARSPAGPA